MKKVRHISLVLVLLVVAAGHALTRKTQKIQGWIKSDPSVRYDFAMRAEGLFQVQPLK